jgi:hypothetical protein
MTPDILHVDDLYLSYNAGNIAVSAAPTGDEARMSRRVMSRLMWIPVHIFNELEPLSKPPYAVILSREVAKPLT